MKKPSILALVAAPLAMLALTALSQPGDSAVRVTMGVLAPSHASAQHFSTADALKDCNRDNRACSDGERGLHQGVDVRGLLAASDTGHITKGRFGADVFADQEMAVANDTDDQPDVL